MPATGITGALNHRIVIRRMNMYQTTYENDHAGNDLAVAAHEAGHRVHALLRTIRTWRQRSAQRRALSQLSQRLLEDSGITRQQRYEEIRKPFWRA